MKNKINASEIQRKGLKRVYQEIDNYESFAIENNRREFALYLTKYKNNLGRVIQIMCKYKSKLDEVGLSSVYILDSLTHGEVTSKSDVDIAFDIKDKKELELLKVIQVTDKVRSISEE